MKKDLYKVLGVNQEADPHRIKKAYRKAAKQYHPDVSPKSEEKFKEIQEAYETLSNPEKRALYDQKSLNKPMMSVGPSPPSHFTPIESLFHVFDEMEEIFSYFERSWMNEVHHFFSERGEGQEVISTEIILRPEEAKKGCSIPLKIPIWINCSRCLGTGYRRGWGTH